MSLAGDFPWQTIFLRGGVLILHQNSYGLGLEHGSYAAAHLLGGAPAFNVRGHASDIQDCGPRIFVWIVSAVLVGLGCFARRRHQPALAYCWDHSG